MGFEDETWFSRLARPSMHTWTEADQPLRLVEQSVPEDDPDPKALACYGLLVRWLPREGSPKGEVWLRFVDGHPVSGVTTAFLGWACGKLEALGKRALLLVWDNASGTSARGSKAGLRNTTVGPREKERGTDSALPPAPQKPLAQPHGTPLGPCQAQSGRGGQAAGGWRIGPTRL